MTLRYCTRKSVFVDSLHVLYNKVQFALLRLPAAADTPQTSKTSRDIFIGWVGPKVGIVQKGRKNAHVGEVKELLKVTNYPKEIQGDN